MIKYIGPSAYEVQARVNKYILVFTTGSTVTGNTSKNWIILHNGD